ncbi:hypothetical protein Ddc_13750 [Ditylenchus destructor]|nr:hypothetical protein Ddc_13750 [Ditylenchus destructor]
MAHFEGLEQGSKMSHQPDGTRLSVESYSASGIEIEHSALPASVQAPESISQLDHLPIQPQPSSKQIFAVQAPESISQLDNNQFCSKPDRQRPGKHSKLKPTRQALKAQANQLPIIWHIQGTLKSLPNQPSNPPKPAQINQLN